MATIGELMDALKGKGADADPIRPEGTGTHSYVGVNEDQEEEVGTYESTVVMDQDDVPESVLDKARDFLYAKTSGEGDIREANYWPVGDQEPTAWSMMDENGKPSPKTKAAYGFTGTFEEALSDAITVFEAEGSFFGTTVRHGEDLLSKTAQEDGHGILVEVAGDLESRINEVLEEAHPESRTTVKSVLGGQDRFSRGYYPPDESFNTDKDTGSAGSQHYGKESPITGRSKSKVGGYTPDRPYISEADMPKTFLNRDPMFASENTTRWDAAPWKDLDGWSSQWDSISGDGFDEWEAKYAYAQNLVSMLQTHNADTPDDWYLGKQSFIMALILKVLFELLGIGMGVLLKGAGLPNIGLKPEYTKNYQRDFGSSWKTKTDYSKPVPPPTGMDALLGAVGDALGGLFGTDGQDKIETVMGMLQLPIPWNTLEAISDDYDNVWQGIAEEFFSLMGDYVGADETMINYLRPILKHFIALFGDMEKWRPPQTDNPLAIPDMFIYLISQSPIIRFLRAIFNVCEGYFASGGQDGTSSFSLAPVKAGANSYGSWSDHPATRPFRSRTMVRVGFDGSPQNKWIAAQSIQMLPSMYLIPECLQTAAKFAGNPYSRVGPYLIGNKQSSPWARKLIEDSAYKDSPGSAVVAKGGVPKLGGNRFSPDEVNFMENMLEAEHMPFYIQDLRTNEIIAFHAFLSSLSDSFSPSFKATSGFGRIEDVQIYEKTSRAIGVTFTMAAMKDSDLSELYWKLNKLVTMIYPQWSKGTMMEGKLKDGEPVKFRQPFSQIPTATPVVRLRVGDLIKSNYSKLNMMNLFGAQDAEFMTVDAEKYQKDMKDAWEAKIRANAMIGAKVTPVNDDGTLDESKGIPVDSYVWIKIKTKGMNAMNETLANDGKEAKSWGGNKKFRYQTFPAKIIKYVDISANYGPGKEHDTCGVLVKYAHPNGETPVKSLMWRRRTRYGSKDEGICSYDEIDFAKWDEILEWNTAHWNSKRGDWMIPDEAPDFTKDMAEPDEAAKLIFSPDTNPYFKSFESSMGRGLAGIINSLSFNYKLNEAPWETEFDSRGPTMIEVTLGFTPIHDIQPGLDAYGGNRAPVFPIGGSGLNSDPWSPSVGKTSPNIHDIYSTHEHVLNNFDKGLLPEYGPDEEPE